MTITTTPMTFDEYLASDDGTDKRYEWIAGALVEMPTESELEDIVFSGDDIILSPTFPTFALTANEVLNPAE